MNNKSTNDGFIMDMWEKFFNFLSIISVFYLIRKTLGDKVKKPYSFVEWWVIGNLFAAVVGSLVVYTTRNRVILWILIIYGISSVFEIVVYQLNVILFDSYRAQKKGKTYKVKSVSRMLVLLVHNYIEIVFWYAVMALTIITFNNSTISFSWAHYIKSSFLCVATFNGEAVVLNGKFLSKIAFFETVSGIILTIVSIARCIGTLPAVEEVDASKSHHYIKKCYHREVE